MRTRAPPRAAGLLGRRRGGPPPPAPLFLAAALAFPPLDPAEALQCRTNCYLQGVVPEGRLGHVRRLRRSCCGLRQELPPAVTAYLQCDISHVVRVADRLAEMGMATAPVIRDAPLRLPPSGRLLGPRQRGESRARRKHVQRV